MIVNTRDDVDLNRDSSDGGGEKHSHSVTNSTNSEGRVKGFPGRIQVTGREESRMTSRLIA